MSEAALLALALEALPLASPKAVAQLSFAVVPLLAEEAGRRLVEQVTSRLSPDAWVWFCEQASDCSPEAARGAMVEAVLAIPAGTRRRVEGLCALAPWVGDRLRKEALAGILDGTAPELDWSQPEVDCETLHYRLVRRMADEDKEAFIAFRARNINVGAELHTELVTRTALDHWPEEAVLRLWGEAHAAAERSWRALKIARLLVPHLPDDLLEWLLRLARSCPDRELGRSLLLSSLRGLGESERASVAGPAHCPEEPTHAARYLWLARRHLPLMPYQTSLDWLARVERIADPEARTNALSLLAPHLEGKDRERALSLLVGTALDAGTWGQLARGIELHPAQTLVDLLRLGLRSDGEIPGLFALVDELGRRDAADEQQQCLPDLAAFLAGGDDPSWRLETLASLASWRFMTGEGGFARKWAEAVICFLREALPSP